MRSRTSTWRAVAAALLSGVFFLVAMSIVLNISDRNVEKSSRRRVGRCLGLMVIAPVEGSIIICWRADEAEETTMPRAEPGAAIYGSLFALGAPSRMVIIGKLAVSRCFFTRMSSWEKAHSLAETSLVEVTACLEVVGEGVWTIELVELDGGGVAGEAG